MIALVATLIFGLLQESLPDDVASKSPDPVPPDRVWEMAEEYYSRIGEAVIRGNVEEARRWNLLAIARLPKPYQIRLSDINAMLQPGPSAGDAASFLTEAGIAVGKWGSASPETGKPSFPLLPRTDVATLFAFRGEWGAALTCLTGHEGRQGRIETELRRDFTALKAAANSPADLIKLASRLHSANRGSHAAAFIVLGRLKASPQRVAALQAGAAYLREIGDEAGARAWEDRLTTLKEAPVDDVADIVLKRSNDSFERGEYQAADEGYRRILRELPRCRIHGRARYNLGFSLQKQGRTSEAREEFQRLIESDVNDSEPGQSLMEWFRNYRPRAIVHIGECFEAEGNWEEALEAYRDQRRYPMQSFSGTDLAFYASNAQTRIARCLAALGRNDEAMNICRAMLFETGDRLGFGSTELSILAVDLAIRMGKEVEFERDLEARLSESAGHGGPATALKYFKILRLKVAGDIEGLFRAMIDPANSRFGWQNDYRWEKLKADGRLAIEAAECLAELGEPAFTWLESQAQGEGSWQTWATIALAHFRGERADAIVRKPPSLPLSNGPQFVRMLESIHAEIPRNRQYPRSATSLQNDPLGFGHPLILVGMALFSLAAVAGWRRWRGAPGANPKSQISNLM